MSLDATSHTQIDERELPLASTPDIPLWSENYCWEWHCPEQDVGGFFHLSRQSYDTSIFRETFVVFLPEGKMAIYKGYGKGGHEAGPGGGQLRFRCEESFERWVLEFDGAARIVDQGEVDIDAAGPLCDGDYFHVKLKLTSEAATPIWDLGAAISTHSWGKAHYQQGVRLSGEIAFDGQHLDLKGLGVRDHTRGPRNFASLGTWAWITTSLSNGRHLIALAMNGAVGTDQPPVRLAMVSTKDEVREAEIVSIDIFDGDSGRRQDFELRIQELGGEVEIIKGRRNRIYVMSPMPPNQLIIGPDRKAPVYSTEALTTFSWNGEECHGFVELGVLPD